jgi:uncharacterized protein (DUF1697 family)
MSSPRGGYAVERVDARSGSDRVETHDGLTSTTQADHMPAYFALLRGVNVGKSRRIPMADLRAVLVTLGYTGVATLLNSGNAVFRCGTRAPARLASEIAAEIKRRLGFEVTVIVKPARDLALVAAENPLAGSAPDHARLLVAFAQDASALASLEEVERLVAPAERFFIGRHAAYLHCTNGLLESKAGVALLGKAGLSATTRNWATVLKLQKLARDNETQPGRSP